MALASIAQRKQSQKGGFDCSGTSQSMLAYSPIQAGSSRCVQVRSKASPGAQRPPPCCSTIISILYDRYRLYCALSTQQKPEIELSFLNPSSIVSRPSRKEPERMAYRDCPLAKLHVIPTLRTFYFSRLVQIKAMQGGGIAFAPPRLAATEARSAANSAANAHHTCTRTHRADGYECY